jgi:hypothetical protein
MDRTDGRRVTLYGLLVRYVITELEEKTLAITARSSPFQGTAWVADMTGSD